MFLLLYKLVIKNSRIYTKNDKRKKIIKKVKIEKLSF